MIKYSNTNDLELFFSQFKRMPEYLSLEQVAKIVKHPAPSMNFPGKGTSIRPWIILLATATVIILVSVLYFSNHIDSKSRANNTPIVENVSPPENHLPAVAEDTIEKVLLESPETEKQSVLIDGELSTAMTSENPHQLEKEYLKREGSQEIIQESMDGNPFIVDDLSLEELGALGFDIRHYSVFYRNTQPGAKCLFVSICNRIGKYITHAKPETIIKSSRGEGENVIRDMNVLLHDTLARETPFYHQNITKQNMPGQKRKLEFYQFASTEKNYFPVYISTLDGSVSGIIPTAEFPQSKDTLVPVIVPFSRLNCNQKKDLVFWFHATDDFFNDLPGRYDQLESIISSNKSKKRSNPDQMLVNYDFQDWISGKIIPPNKVVDGSGFILNLNREEQERIGMFRDKENDKLMQYFYLTPWGDGRGLGGSSRWVKTSNIPGRDSIRTTNYDTTMNVDFLPVLLSDTLGENISSSTTGRYLSASLIADDVLIPIKVDDRIYWFSQSEDLWIRLPKRYQHLKETYQKILFTKSIYPDNDLVNYFEQERQYVDMNVTILDLNKSELENLGFTFLKDSVVIQSSVYNGEWLQFRINFPFNYSRMPKEALDRVIGTRGLLTVPQVVNDENKDFHKEKNGLEYKELMESPYQGFQWIMVTDETGHELVRLRTAARKEYLTGKGSQYLIPVRVPLDQYFSEYSETKIFWFTPTEAFFDRLPDRINKELRHDFYSLTENMDESTCTYFEDCRSTLELTEFRIFPNPAGESVSISFNTPARVTGTIYLFDIRGSIIKTLESEQAMPAGSNTFHFPLDGIQPGIYLVAIQSEGAIRTGRLIVTD